MFTKLKKSDSDLEKREKLFFHDIINQTHGLLLFFTQKESQNQKIEVPEIKMLEREVRALQSLIKDHFHLKHKNLHCSLDWVPFHVAESSLVALINHYLSAPEVKTFINLKGDLAYDKSILEREKAEVYFPAFYRIMNNLIKNMAEAKSTEIYFTFDYGEAGFLIETKNKFNSKADLANISDQLSQIILDELPQGAGLGLESIHHMALESGGVFNFEIYNDLWINHISLPLRSKENISKKAA